MIRFSHDTLRATGQTKKGVIMLKELSAEERKLLIAAAKDGELRCIEPDGGKFIMVGGQAFPATQSDPAITVKYFEALENLRKRDYIAYAGGHVCMLTGSGFKKARELAAEEKASQD